MKSFSYLFATWVNDFFYQNFCQITVRFLLALVDLDEVRSKMFCLDSAGHTPRFLTMSSKYLVLALKNKAVIRNM